MLKEFEKRINASYNKIKENKYRIKHKENIPIKFVLKIAKFLTKFLKNDVNFCKYYVTILIVCN